MNFWVVRAGRGGVAAERWLDGGYIEVGFGAKALGAGVIGMTREMLLDQLREVMPERKEGQVINQAGQLYDALDPETKQLVALRRLYWPIEPTD